MNIKFHSILFKICLSILLIETVLLGIMGNYYVKRFSGEVHQRVSEKLRLPAILLSQHALNLEVVENREALGNLVQEQILTACIVQIDGVVSHSSTKALKGLLLKTLLHKDEAPLLKNRKTPGHRTVFAQNSGKKFISSIHPIVSSGTLQGYLYLRIDGTKIEDEIQKITLLFLFGSLLTIFLTTLLEGVFVYYLFIPRVKSISSALQLVEKGDFAAQVEQPGPPDELHCLIIQVNDMITSIQKNFIALQSTRQQLEKSIDRFREMADLFPEAIFETDAQGYFTYVNNRAVELLQFNREELLHGLNCRDLVTEQEKVEKVIQGRFAKTVTGLIEYTGIKKDGSTFPARIHSAAIFENGNIIGLRGIVIDDSEKNRLQEQLRQAQKMEAIGRLAASISHEFGNPLVGIYWLLKDINKMPSLDAATKESTEIALQELQKMKGYLYDFQKFSRPSTGIHQVINIDDILNNCLLLFKKYLRERNITVTRSPDQTGLQIQAVADQLNQVFINLIMNGVEAMSINGGHLHLKTFQKGKNIAVSIEDTGCGISEENREHIFEPFFSTKPEVEGMGLGLYISYGIIQGYGGDITVESTPGKGSVFTVTLPVASSKTPLSSCKLEDLS